MSTYDRRMSELNYAIDAYIGDLARRGRSKETRRKYTTVLWKLSDHVQERDCDAITAEQCRSFLDRWVDASASTMALHVSILAGFFQFLVGETVLEQSPMRNIRRPARKRPEDLDVVTVGESDVGRMIRACTETDELVCIAMLAYTGARRTALANLRRRDLDLDHGLVRFREKGSKVIVKPLPDELHALLRDLDEGGEWVGPEEYVVKNRRATRTPDRSSKVIYRIVTDVAKRARVRSHVHALRAAFAVRYLESPDGTLEGLKNLLGHSRYETTGVYLRRMDKQRSMESVRGLSWGSGVFPPNAGMPPTGFEPVFPAIGVPDPLRRKLAELRARSDARNRVRG